MEFQIPKTQINEINFPSFPKSKIYNKIMIFITNIQSSLVDVPMPYPEITHPTLLQVQQLLNNTKSLLSSIPALENQPLRYGNPAYRTFYKELKNSSDHLKTIQGYEEFIVYYNESFGNHQRIDYGTGHELNFILFLLCLQEINLIEAEKQIFIQIFLLFNQYIDLMRQIQLQYRLEPAGSHGVWGIDDYQFLTFLFGASQLINNGDVEKPEDGIKESYLNKYGDKFIKDVKKNVAFHECSPILYDISGAATWNKVSAGLVKMYQAEVLQKLPVARHIMFGTILPLQ